MKTIIKNNAGLTLVEVIIAMTILVIIAAAFVPLFSTSFAHIFTYGHKDRAMANASELFEELYAKQPFADDDEIKDILGNEHNVEESNLTNYDDKDYNYYIDESFQPITGATDVEGFKVTIVYFYQDGEKYVQLSSFVRGD